MSRVFKFLLALLGAAAISAVDSGSFAIASPTSDDDGFIGSLPDPEQQSNSEAQPMVPAPSQASPVDSRQGGAANQSDSTQDDEADGTDAYPRVTALENAILNQSYRQEDLASRLSRLEKKAFGSASSDSDLSQRTDALESYALTKLHKKIVEEAPPDLSSDDAYFSPASPAADGQSNASDYPRVDAIEQAILGQSHQGEALDQRLARMESKVFGAASKSDDLSTRTDNLEAYAVKKLHMKPFEHPPDGVATTGGAPQGGFSKKLLSAVASSLLSGLGGAGPAGIGMNPYGYPGYGAGAIGPFGGVRIRPRSSVPQSQNQQVQESPEQQAEEQYDDQLIHAATPPPPQARLITKVGWCEVQVFGHTFAKMHLTERLTQLNRELNFAPGKSNLELMDDIASLMKAVSSRKAAQSPAAGGM